MVKQHRVVHEISLTVVFHTNLKEKNSDTGILEALTSVTVKNLLLTSSFLVCAACSQQTASEKLVKSLKTVQSWTATAQMVGETWQQGTVPDAYAQQSLEKSQQEIARETKDLAAPSALQQPLRQLQQTLQKMTVDVKQHHNAEMATSLQQLSKQQQQLNTFVRAQGEQP